MDQLPLPRDRLLERRWALSKIDGHCQKMISPRPDASPRRSSNPRQRCLLGRAGGPHLAQLLPKAGSPRCPRDKRSLQGRHPGGRAERLWGSRGPCPLGKSGGSCLYPLKSICTSKPSAEPGTAQAPGEC